MNTVRSQNRNSRRILLMLLIAASVVAAVIQYAHSTGALLKEQAYYAAARNVEAIANEIEASIGFAQSSIRLTSQSATQSMTGDVIENVNAILDPLLDSTPFNFIEYILADGWNTMNDGGEPFDASDREYYQQGIAGNTGIWINFAPKKSKEVLLNFYTPLYYEGRIVGVFTGTLGGDTNMKPLLQSVFMGQEVYGFLCDSDGSIIASNVEGLATGTAIRTYLTQTMGVSEEDYGIFRDHVSGGDWTAFDFRENGGSAVGCIALVENPGWYVVQIVPAGSMTHIMKASTMQSVFVVGLVSCLFILFFLYVNQEQRKKNEQEIAEHRGVVEVLGKEYSSVYLVDTQTGLMEPYRLKEGIRRHYGRAMETGLLWDDGVTDYARRFVREDYREEFLRKCSLDHLLAQLQEDGGMYSFEFINDRDGEQHVYRVIASMLPDSRVRCIVIGFADINEERERELAMQKTLQAALDAAETANRAKTDFLSKMSHDIRTPLNGIMGLLEMDERHPDDKRLIEENRGKIKVATKHLNSLLNDILQLSKLESGHVELAHEAFDLNALATDIITMAAIEASERGIAFYHGDCSGNLIAPFVYGSPLHLRQIFLNIFSNAIKYNKPGGSISCEAECSAIDGNTVTYSCTISDTGIGMSREFVEHIFDPFSQERNDARSTYQGTGLGMAIVKSLVDRMGGTIEIESIQGEGSTFVVTIPFEIAQSPETENPEPEEHEASIQNLHILVVEDNQLNMEIAEFLLADAGAAVTKAFDGKQAVDLFAKNPAGTFDAILMDVMMPVMNGIEATKAIRLMDRSDARMIPIIAMTANAFDEDRQATRNAGMNAHLSKPLDGKEVIRVISKYSQR